MEELSAKITEPTAEELSAIEMEFGIPAEQASPDNNVFAPLDPEKVYRSSDMLTLETV